MAIRPDPPAAPSPIAAPPTATPARPAVLRARAIALGLALVPLNVYWVIFAELRWYNVLTLNPLFVTPVVFLLALSGWNLHLRRARPHWAFSPAELLTIYIMLVMSCTVATHDFLINLMSVIGWPRWSANASNNWETVLFPHLPKWLYVWDKELLAGAFTGGASLYRWEVLRMWAAPLGFWSIFILSVGLTMLCVNVLIRKAWVEQTRLSFPIIRLPLALVEEPRPGATICSRGLWIGFALVMALNTLNGLHEWYPSLPHLQTRAQWLNFTSPALAEMEPLAVTFYPFAIGLAFLVPLDVAFSCWFFFLFLKTQSVIGYWLGHGDTPDFPYLSEQCIGAWLTFALYLLWIMRGYLRDAVATAWRGDRRDEGEPMSYRTALIGLLVGCSVFFVFWWQAGMSPGWVVVVLVSYLLLSLAITRVRAEAGGQHTVWDLEPMRVFRLFDSQALGASNIAAAGLSHWYWRLNRSHVMPSQLEAFRMAQEHHVPLRRLVWPMLAAYAVATIAGMWACLHVFYGEGALAKCRGFAAWTVTETFSFMELGIGAGFDAEPGRWVAVAGASLGMGFMAWMRARFTWFPFHPLGYCIGPWLVWLWMPFFIAWASKLLLLRYGGLRLYRAALPFFLGIVLGDYTSAGIWSLIGVIWNVPTYQIFH
ncbi:MAG TPA: DUF6785 family protein [Chthonomonadales bacterium]|nr:DUF6785 family protein [Chthonomonadales bacterium]